MSTERREPQRVFKQKRAERTHAAILAAAVDVFGREGLEGAQVPDIAKAAGVSTGAVYRYFTDKREIFLEVMRRRLEAGRADIHERLSLERFVGTDTRTAIALVIDTLFDLVRKDAALNRVYLALSITDPDVAALRAASEAEHRASLTQLIAAAIPKELVPNPEAAAIVIQIAALEAAAERAGLRPRKGKRVTDRDVKQALGDMLHRYLFGA